MEKYLKVSVILSLMGEVKVTNLVKLYAMLLLRKKPMHGYELIGELEGCLSRSISASQVYPFLSVLQKNRLIRLKNSGKRDKKQYELTAEGHKFSQNLINRFAELVETRVGKKVTACSHCGCKIAEGGYKEKSSMFCCKMCAASYKRG